ncbi:unnamed protein product [Auanema sp. JU1783]|nr:unnamed protein product [Auanema sp. JU1783]
MFDTVPKFELDDNEAEVSGSTEPLNRTFETGVNTEKLTALISHGSRTVTRPVKPRDSNASAALNTTRTMIREKPNATVVESQLVSDIRRVLSRAKMNGTPDLSDLEKKLICTVQKHENVFDDKHHIEASSSSKASTELLMYKHFNADLRKMVKLLISEVQKRGGAKTTIKACDGSCEHSRKLSLDLQNAAADVEAQHKDYEKLMEQFDYNRKLLQQQKHDYINLENILNEEREMYKQLMEKFLRLRHHAIRQLEHASGEIVNCENKHEEDTKGLRLKVKAFELEIKNLREAVLLKRKENDDLQRMLRSIVTDLEVPSDTSDPDNWIN